jgi:predicted house-cleaning noncanonical NTP pyrophosphatase (MazG superfamily)
MTFEQLFREHGQWTMETFPGHTLIGHINKLKTECDEIMESPNDVMEFADVLLAFMSMANAAGFDPREILTAAEIKLNINRSRKWRKLPDGSYQHI